MTDTKPQAKDVPERPILAFLCAIEPYWANWFPDSERSVLNVAPGYPAKVVHAKMRAMIRRGLVDGCPCGCRGDFRLTDAGRSVLGLPPALPPKGARVPWSR